MSKSNPERLDGTASAPPAAQAGSPSLAEQIAEALDQEIVRLGCPVGRTVGNEIDLAQRYGVSRSVMREALAITDHAGLTGARRGRNGGVIVAASAESAAAAALCNCLLFARLDVGELFAVRKIVERTVHVLAARQLDDDQIAAAIELVDRPVKGALLDHSIEIYEETLRLADNHFVAIFASALSRLTLCQIALHEVGSLHAGEDLPIARVLMEVRRRELECVIAGDPAGAIEASAAAFEAWVQLFSQPPPRRAHSAAARAARVELVARRITETLHPGKQPKPSNVLATRIGLHILREQLQPGEPVAPEPELMKMFGVGRHVVREAIRVLQRDGVVETGVGRHGGLRVGAPDATSVVRRTVGYLRLLGVRQEDVRLLAVEMLALAAEIAAARLYDNPRGVSVKPLADHIEALSGLAKADPIKWLYGLGALLATLAENPILQLFFSLVLAFHQPAGTPSRGDRPAMAAAGGKLLAAVEGGDTRLSRRASAQLISGAGL